MKHIKIFENFENKLAFDEEIRYELKRYLINEINPNERVEQLMNIHKNFIDNVKDKLSANEIAKKLYLYNKNLKNNKR
jgi:hypothetical protein